MSPATQAAIIGGIAGGAVGGLFTLFGVALGLFGERYVRERGKLRCEIDAWTGADNPSFGEPEVRRFEVTFINGKDVALALWDIRIEFVSEDGDPERVEIRLLTGEWVSVLNIPARAAVSKGMQVTVGGAVLYKIKHARRLRLVGAIAGSKEFSKELPRW